MLLEVKHIKPPRFMAENEGEGRESNRLGLGGVNVTIDLLSFQRFEYRRSLAGETAGFARPEMFANRHAHLTDCVQKRTKTRRRATRYGNSWT